MKTILDKLPKLVKQYTSCFYMDKYYDRKAGFIAGYKAAIKQFELKQKEDKQ